MIPSPYPEATLDTFGFPVGGRLAARRPISSPQLPKVTLFGPKMQFFLARNHFFCGQPQKNCYHYDRTPKRQPFCVDRRSGWSLGGRQGPFLGQKWPENLIFFLHYTHITHLFWSQTDPTQWDHNIPMSWGNSGYLWFSSRCPIGCLASSCMAPIAKNYGIANHNISKRFAVGCYFERAPTNLVDF